MMLMTRTDSCFGKWVFWNLFFFFSSFLFSSSFGDGPDLRLGGKNGRRSQFLGLWVFWGVGSLDRPPPEK